MKRIKTIFYAVYILYIVFGIFIGVFYESLVLRWDWDWLDTWTSLIRFVMKMGAIGLFLMIAQMVLENILVYNKNKEISVLEIQITELKAKLNDKPQENSDLHPVQ